MVFSFIIGLIFGLVGADSAAAFLGSLGIFQPMMAALIGLVPNCGASVLLAQLYMGGAITFGSFFAGLCSGAAAYIHIPAVFRTDEAYVLHMHLSAGIRAAGHAHFYARRHFFFMVALVQLHP